MPWNTKKVQKHIKQQGGFNCRDTHLHITLIKAYKFNKDWESPTSSQNIGNFAGIVVFNKNLRLEVWVSCWTFGLTMSSWRQKNGLCLRDDPCNGFPILPWGKIWSWDFLQIYLPFMEGYVLYFMRARGNCCFFFHPLAALQDQATPENVMQDLPPQNMEKRLRVSVF